MARAQTTTRTTTNREEIRRWVESKGGWPAHVKGTERGNDPGILRIDFPGFSGVETLGKLSWDDWFKWFDKKKLAFVHQPNTRFSKLIARETAATKAGIRATPRRAAGAKRATTKRAAGTKRATTKRAAAKVSRIAKKPAQAPRRAATTSRVSAKRATRPKRAPVKRTTKRGTAKRTTKRGTKRASR